LQICRFAVLLTVVRHCKYKSCISISYQYFAQHQWKRQFSLRKITNGNATNVVFNFPELPKCDMIWLSGKLWNVQI
jgi:hypothetical protein